MAEQLPLLRPYQKEFGIMAKMSSVAAMLTISLWTSAASIAGDDLREGDETPAGVELTGQVYDVDDKPVAGATVLVWTAGVKTGYSTFCPSCYADCGKRSTTDVDGAFALHRLSPNLRFRLLIIREGFAPTFVDQVDPVVGAAVSVTIPRRETPQDIKQVVHGRIVGPTGEPIGDAVVEPEMVWFLNENGSLGGSGGAVKGLDPVAVSNAAGEFEIAYAKPAVKMTLMVKARGHAPKRFVELATGEERHKLSISTGATVSGRLVHRGKPVAGAEMGIVSIERSIGKFFAEERIGTQRDGNFLFANVPAPGKWYVYAKMASIVQIGATPAISSVTTRDDEMINLGDIEIGTGHRLSGQVVLTDGTPIPEGMRILLSSNRAWDSQTALLPADGRFEFVNLPASNYTISPMVKGYRLADQNPNHAGLGVKGVINRDIDDFMILVEPGQYDFKKRRAGNLEGKALQSAARP